MVATADAIMESSGEMAQLIRQYDWASTEFGAIPTWPPTLRTVVNLMLNARFPMFVYWGKASVCFYNDAYRPSLGRNADYLAILGKPASEARKDVWPVAGPVIRQVLDDGMPAWKEDQPVQLFRNGRMENSFWTHSYSRIVDEKMCAAGVLVTCTETTGKVQRLEKLLEARSGFAEKNLAEAEAKARAIVENAPFPIGVYSGKKMIIDLANDAILDVWGKGRDVIGRSYMEILPEIAGTGIFEELDAVYTTGHPVHVQNKYLDIVRDGKMEPFFFNYSFTPMYDSAGKIYGVMNTAADVTLLNLAKQKVDGFAEELEQEVAMRTSQLKKQNESLQRMNEDLKAFAHVSSHDLQEPLRKIITYCNRLADTDEETMSPEGKQFFTKIMSSAQRMRKLIQDLLSYAKLGSIDRILETVDLIEIIREVKRELKDLAEEKKAEIVILGERASVQGVRFQFMQLFQNLLANSLKFSSPLRKPLITIKSEIVKGASSGIGNLVSGDDYCHIELQDNGVGFNPEYTDKLFQVFQRLHSEGQYKGTGIGLAIVKKIVDNHHGCIAASGSPDEGAVFQIYLPVSMH